MHHLHAKQQHPKLGLASLAMIALASVSTLDRAEAASRSRHSENDAQESLSREAVMAIVSIKDQSVTVYDADGGRMRARFRADGQATRRPSASTAFCKRKRNTTPTSTMTLRCTSCSGSHGLE